MHSHIIPPWILFIYLFTRAHTRRALMHIKTAAQTLKARDASTHRLGWCTDIPQEILIFWSEYLFWAGTASDNCVVFKDKEKTWQGAVLKIKSRRPFRSHFPPFWSCKAARAFSSLVHSRLGAFSAWHDPYLDWYSTMASSYMSVYLHMSLCYCLSWYELNDTVTLFVLRL